MIKQLIYIASITILMLSCSIKASDTDKGQSSIDKKVDSLLAEMTLEEKIGQLNLPSAGDVSTGISTNSGIALQIKEGKVGGLFNIKGIDKIKQAQKIAVEESRIGIPLLFAMDVIHGYKTVFPIPLGLSCTWDLELIEQSARIAAQEATADGIAWTFSPMVDISRDPRWGRTSEGVGEDPYLGYQIAAAMVRGYQGNDLSLKNTMMACVKHFALYGASEAGRDYNTVDMSRLRMYNDYFPPYKGAVDAGVGSVMASFNEVDGIPATGSKWLMTEVLRNQWGFDGLVVSDYTGINEMIAHGMGDLQQVSALALKAGVDMDMVGEGFLTTLTKSLEEGKLTVEDIDTACRRILEAKFKLGLFDDPYRYIDEKRSESEIFTAENRAIARKTAAESMVLLKNEGVLPLAKNTKIALIGPLANNVENMVGTWSVSADVDKSISIYEGLRQSADNSVNISYAKGANVVEDAKLEERISVFGKNTYRDNRPEAEMVEEALKVASQSDVIVAVLGEASESSGESSSVTSLELPANQRRLLKKLSETGKPVVMVLLTGRPLSIKWEQDYTSAIVNAWFAGSEAGSAIADIIYGDVNPSGKLSMTFPQNVGQVPIYYNHKNTGRPLEGEWFQKFKSNYLDVTNEPLFPFGYGLSYSEFEYGEMKLSSEKLKGNDKLKITIPVTNTAKIDGKEVVQLYIRDMVGSTTRPVKELKGFQKLMIKAGETKEVTFTISTDDLKYYTYDNQIDQNIIHTWEAGEFQIMVGTNSNDVKSKMISWKK
ncbi:beta-glucosidase BglX [Marivirga sp. S37H4]|uniref:Periplasmic beta-glucosidase n=1 Tax=Marivirga aurantiaca TaxID=2802615 RepID=A0A935C8M3_9BACT|nr:beta-glucosidase BglX [Marivirga aurantiaca]MBK6265047.1 beta-glucosidase BglX [Marivirga aurantiaca]